MEIIITSIRKVTFGIAVLIINIPIFWSFYGATDFLKGMAKFIGVEV